MIHSDGASTARADQLANMGGARTHHGEANGGGTRLNDGRWIIAPHVHISHSNSESVSPEEADDARTREVPF